MEDLIRHLPFHRRCRILPKILDERILNLIAKSSSLLGGAPLASRSYVFFYKRADFLLQAFRFLGVR